LTMQTFFVLLSGALLGAGLGGLSQASYMILGLAGVPLFASIAGLGYLMGPTGGYILGFLPASILIGQAMKRQNNSLLSIFVLMCAADALLLLCGMLWLKVLSGYSFSKLFVIGFLPFIPGDMIKAAAASVIALKLMPRMRKAL
jgi:biotin transport system substrate-specific component